MIIKTKNLILRPVENTDAQDIFEYSSQADVGIDAGWEPHRDIEQTKMIMAAVFVGIDGVFAICDKNSNKVIGTVGVIDDPKRQNPHVKMLGFALNHDFWNMGYMSESVNAVIEFAFKILKLDAVSAYTYPYNIASARVLKKCGFKKEATLSMCEQRYDGKIMDNDCYILRK